MDERHIPQKPLCLTYQEAKEEIFAAINTAAEKHGLPPFLLSEILAEAYGQAKAGAQVEVEVAKANYYARKDDTK